MYWYGRVKEGLVYDVMPHSYIWASPVDEEAFGMFMWLSGDDVRPPIHYDEDHNFFVHVSGKKRFVLYPPWEYPKMYVFPRIHPRWHKSQVSFDTPNLSKTPKYQQVKAYEAVLSPGEVLYVPPYWFHHVQSISKCVSLATWSDSGLHREMKMLYKNYPRFEDIEDPTERKAKGRAYIELLLERIEGKNRVQSFVREMVESRWEPLYDIFQSDDQQHEQSDLCHLGKWNLQQLKMSYEKNVEYAVERFNNVQIPNPPTTKDIRAIRSLEIADFIEIISSILVPTQDVYSFLKRCFK